MIGRRFRALISVLVGLGLALLAATPAPAGSSGAIGTYTVSDSALRVATYNVLKVNSGKGQFVWANRRAALQRTVATIAPDILAVQEANTQKWNGMRHIDDVMNVLGAVGYQIASADFTGCPLTCTRGAHIFYNPARARLAELPGSTVPVAGMVGMSVIGQIGLGPIQDRAVSWAFMSPMGSDRVTLVISVHLATEKNALGEAARVGVAARLRPWADSMIAASGRPAEIVIAGDFNSYDRRQPLGAQRILADSGLINSYNAPVRVNGDIGSVNMAPKIAKFKGFPPAPYRYRANTTHIDYVFSTVAPLRHEVVAFLLPDGSFDNAYRASDHNMVVADLPLR